MAEISILRALNEVSLINKKIDNLNNINKTFVSHSIGGKPPTGFKSIQEMIDSINSYYQSVIDLIKRRTAIKVAIVSSNAVTNIIINNEQMTVAGAIELKTSIIYEKNLLMKLVSCSATSNRNVENHNANIEEQIEDLIRQTFGSKNSKISKEEQDAIAVPYRKTRIAELIDPLDVKTKIEYLENKIREFECNVDNILTESNATTMITIPDN